MLNFERTQSPSLNLCVLIESNWLTYTAAAITPRLNAASATESSGTSPLSHSGPAPHLRHLAICGLPKDVTVRAVSPNSRVVGSAILTTHQGVRNTFVCIDYVLAGDT